jgi:pentatricopeptide repeat protein
MLEVLLKADGDQNLLSADKYTVSQMLAKTTGPGGRFNKDATARGISLGQSFIEFFPSDVDEGLFNAILGACCQLKDVQRLEEVMEKMLQLQVEPSAVTLGILVKTYGRAGNLEMVKSVWNEMQAQRKQANEVTYGCMLDACVKCGDLQQALQVFEEVKKEGKHRNTVLYTTLIKGCSAQKNLQVALTLFREMKEERVSYNTFTYNSIIDVCINSGAMTVAEGIFSQMITEEANRHGASPDIITFSTLLKGYCQAGLFDQAFMVVEAIRERGLPCDELVYNTLIDGCVKIGDLGMGLGFFEEMLRDGATPSPITHSILVKLYRGAGYGQRSSEAVAGLYQHHGLQPPVICTRRQGKARHNKHRGTSPHGLLVQSRHQAHRPSIDSSSSFHSQSSHSDSSYSGSLTNMTMEMSANQMACTNQSMPMNPVQNTMPPQCSTMGSLSSSLAAPQLPTEVRSMIEQLPEHMRRGPLLVSGPYAVPTSNAPTPVAQQACSPAKTKPIIKI